MKKAFTLIELLIVVVIIVLFAVVSIPFFDRYGSRAELDAKAEEVRMTIEKAHTFSQSPEQGRNGAVVSFESSSQLITTHYANINPKCISLVKCQIGEFDFVQGITNDRTETINFSPKDGISFATENQKSEIYFLSPDRVRIGLTEDATNAKITINSENVSYGHYEITVTKSPFMVTSTWRESD